MGKSASMKGKIDLKTFDKAMIEGTAVKAEPGFQVCEKICTEFEEARKAVARKEASAVKDSNFKKWYGPASQTLEIGPFPAEDRLVHRS